MEVKTTHDLAHLVFCALVALHLARQDGRVADTASEDRFLVGWLAAAQRHRRFPTLTTDLQWLQEKGIKQGELRAYLLSLWAASTGNGKEASPATRLVAALGALSALGWEHFAVRRIDWLNVGRRPPVPPVPASYIIKTVAQRAFSPEGALKCPMEFQVVGGDAAVFVAHLRKANLQADITRTTATSTWVTLLPAVSAA